MKRFIEGVERTQSTLLPAVLVEYIAEDNGVRIIDACIDSLSLKALGFDGATPANTGRPSYHPANFAEGLANNWSIRSIALHLGRRPSTISQEINRNRGQEGYRASQPDQAARDQLDR